MPVFFERKIRMNLLEKLSGVEIRPDSRISESDRRFCAAHQQAYDTAREELSELRQIWKEIVQHQDDILREVSTESYERTGYIELSGLSTIEIRNKLEAMPEIFISRIVHYFNSRYHVSVELEPVKTALLPEKPKYSWSKEQTKQYHITMRDLPLRYEDILEQIFVQLGGRTFAERAVDELKEKCHHAAWNTYRNTADYEVKSDTIRFTSYACKYDDWLGRPKWSLSDSMKDILRGASHFETGQLEYYPAGVSALLGWDEKDTALFEFTGEKMKSLRMFKNHRVDLKFSSKAYANQFAAEYLGLVA